MIISVFPSIGKTYAYNKMKNDKKLKVFDSDSSQFSWTYVSDNEKIRNENFPTNYIAHIKENMDNATHIFVSSHENVRQAMKTAEIPYILVYPRRDMLPEIVGRCYLRGNNEQFIKTLIENWDNWIDSCETDTGAIDKFEIGNGMYLLDVLELIK